MKILKLVSWIILIIVIFRFIYLLDIISFDIGVISDVGKYMYGWIFGFVGAGINIVLYKKSTESKKRKNILVVGTIFYLLVACLDLLMIYARSRI